MSERATWMVVDLGFGDCGKGTTVDFLARDILARGKGGTDPIHVVRANGGAQAGHNVVDGDGRHHCFAQFGAASFLEDARTHHGPHFVLEPLALLEEAARLSRLGVRDLLGRPALIPI